MAINSVISNDSIDYVKVLSVLPTNSIILIHEDGMSQGSIGSIKIFKFQSFRKLKHDMINLTGDYLECFSNDIVLELYTGESCYLEPGDDELITGSLQDVIDKFKEIYTQYKIDINRKQQYQLDEEEKKGLEKLKNFVK